MNLTKTENQFTHPIFGELTTIINTDNEVFFIGKEVANILEYSDISQLTRRLDDEEIIKINHSDSKLILKQDDIHSSGIQLLTESGLYNAVLGSKKPEAKLFKKWITSEVLPSIRKTGSYSLSVPKTYIEALQALLDSEKEKLRLQESNNNLEVKLDLLLDWVSIIKVSEHNNVKENIFNWRILKSKSLELGYEIKRAKSPRFEYMNLYHINCFKSAYPQYNYNIE